MSKDQPQRFETLAVHAGYSRDPVTRSAAVDMGVMVVMLVACLIKMIVITPAAGETKSKIKAMFPQGMLLGDQFSKAVIMMNVAIGQNDGPFAEVMEKEVAGVNGISCS